MAHAKPDFPDAADDHPYCHMVHLRIHALAVLGSRPSFSGLSRGVINAGVIFWILVFISAILLGRAFCGWFCWFGGYLELIEWGIIDKWKIKIPRRILLYLGVLPFVALAIEGLQFLACDLD